MARESSSSRDAATDYSYAIDSIGSRLRNELATYQGGSLVFPALLVDYVAQPPKDARFSRQDIIDALTLVRGLRILLDDSEGDLLGRARRHGVTFGKIAAALGLRSRQAAEQRYLKLYSGEDSAETQSRERRRRRRFGRPYSQRQFALTVAILSLPSFPKKDGKPEERQEARTSPPSTDNLSRPTRRRPT
jgi:hypothetical protein